MGGHANALEDVRKTGRLNLNPDDPKHTPGTCYSCKSSNNPGLWDEMGMAEFDKTSFMELGARITEPIGCANCHEAGTMRLIVTNPALDEGLKAQGKDWTTFTRQEMRTVVCANCHVEYYFKGPNRPFISLAFRPTGALGFEDKLGLRGGAIGITLGAIATLPTKGKTQIEEEEPGLAGE